MSTGSTTYIEDLPNIKRLDEIEGELRTVEWALERLQDKGVHLAKWHINGEYATLTPSSEIRRLVYEVFGINTAELELERRELLRRHVEGGKDGL